MRQTSTKSMSTEHIVLQLFKIVSNKTGFIVLQSRPAFKDQSVQDQYNWPIHLLKKMPMQPFRTTLALIRISFLSGN